MIKINLGCGDRPLEGFINVDARDLPGIEFPNTRAEDLSCFEDSYADYIYACHILEHVPRKLTFATLCEWNRVLKPGGMLRVAVPDWDATVQYYNETGDLENLLNWIYGGRQHPDDYHNRIFNFPGLRTLLVEAGFKRIHKYDWRETEHANYDDFSKAYIPHMDFENGRLISLNVECIKHAHVKVVHASPVGQLLR
ncbi:MAG: methyltransferase domain-containing protein [Dehalococcoidia bacterium]